MGSQVAKNCETCYYQGNADSDEPCNECWPVLEEYGKAPYWESLEDYVEGNFKCNKPS